MQYGSDSLVGTTFLVKTATEKSNQAIATEESLRNPLLRDAWRALLSACAVIESRSDAGTLLPHGPWRHPRRPVEAAFDALLQAELARACDGAEPPEAVLRAASVASGYAVALDAALMGLHMLQLQQVGVRTPAEQARVQTFVLKTLRLVQETKGQSLTLAPERHLVAFLTRELAPARERYAPAFYDALLAQWTSPGVADVLRARGLLKSAATHIQQDKPGGAEEEGEGAAASAAAASKGEAAAAGGARPQRRHPRHCTYCGVAPGPGQRDFQVCGGCSAVSYCCEAHCRKHWRAGHRGECAALKAAGAAPPATADG